MRDISFQSDTYNKLLKIKDGKVFANSTTFIKEFIQNCQRSKSTRIDFRIWEENGIGYISCIDDGCGCKNPQYLFTLDYSNWKSTSEGFGIGFWSCLAIPDLFNVNIKSKNWEVNVDVANIFKKKSNAINTKELDFDVTGFEVVLSSDWISNNLETIQTTLEEVGKNIDIPIYINGYRIYQVDLISEFIIDCQNNGMPYYEFHNAMYDAVFAISKDYYGGLNMYYENRLVKKLYDFSYVSGIVLAKNGKIDLIEPDRERFVNNAKWYKMRDKMSNNIKEAFRTYLSTFGVSNKDFYDGIAYYLEPKDFKKYLTVSFLNDDFIVEEDELLFNEDNDTKENGTNTTQIVVNNANDKTSIPLNIQKEQINKHLFTENDEQINTFVRNDSCFNNDYEASLIKNDFQNKKNILTKSVWVRSSEMEELKNNVARARYCGIPVIVVDNVLQERALEDSNIPNVATLDDVLSETIIKTNICLKNANEVAFIQLIHPICDRFGLDYDTFHIANLETRREFYYEGKVVMKQREKNTKNKIITYGLCDGKHIYLDRNALKLNSFKLKNCSKATRYAVLLRTSRTIAHELAHYLYGTVDNTILHYKREQQIWQEIVNLYVA